MICNDDLCITSNLKIGMLQCVVVKIITEDYDNKSDPSKVAEVKQLVWCLFEENDCVRGD